MSTSSTRSSIGAARASRTAATISAATSGGTDNSAKATVAQTKRSVKRRRAQAQGQVKDEGKGERDDEDIEPPPKRPRSTRKSAKVSTKQEEEGGGGGEGEVSPLSELSDSPPPIRVTPKPPKSKPKTVRRVAVKAEQAEPLDLENDAESPNDETHTKRTKRARKPTKPKIDPDSVEGVEEDVVDTTGFLPRPSAEDKAFGWNVGAHVSAAGGVENAVVRAAEIGCSAFALFLKSQRKWASPPLTPRSIALFKHRMTQLGYDPKKDVLVHGNYLVNLGNPDEKKRSVSYDCFLDEVRRCGELGIGLLNIHPGSTVSQTTPETSCALIAQCINDVHKATEGGVGREVVVVLENMAGSGNVIGSSFEELAQIIRLVDDKTRVGVCIDTCHAFAAGYDFRTKEGWEDLMTRFDAIVGLGYLRGMHLNDSKVGLGEKKDRHESIGCGHLTLSSFHHIFNDARTQHIPLILETPSWEEPRAVWGVEIGVLRRLVGLDVRPEAAAAVEMDREIESGERIETGDDDDGGGGAREGGGNETTLESLAREVKDAVKRVSGTAVASEGKGAKGARGKVKAKEKTKVAGKGKRAKGGKKDEESDEEEEAAEEGEESDGCCSH